MKIFNLIILVVLLVFNSDTISAQNTKPSKKANNKTVQAAKPKATAQTPVTDFKQGVHMTFENEHLDIGKVKKGEVKKFDFTFTNTGTEIIEIDIASGCDCTTLDYPKSKILPGKKAIIHVTFDSGKKEVSETVDVDLYLKNLNPKTGQRILKIIDYKYELTH
jgi:hypothetical protein